MLCLAGGTGLAPNLSILRGALAQGMANPAHLCFGVRSPRDIYGMDWLDQLKREHRGLSLALLLSCSAAPRSRTWACGAKNGSQGLSP